MKLTGYDTGRSYNRRPEQVSGEFVATVATVLQISEKSYPTLFRTISLLKLPDVIQVAICNLSATNPGTGRQGGTMWMG
ncbi:MAG: hypothetical protein NTX36_03910 [Proteobacteria bacterium]|nr:hypothetical protein [Pseudomonadota bacterium]